MRARGVPTTNGTRSLSEVRGGNVQARSLRKKKGNTDVQVSPFVPDRLGRPLPPRGLRMQWPGLILKPAPSALLGESVNRSLARSSGNLLPCQKRRLDLDQTEVRHLRSVVRERPSSSRRRKGTRAPTFAGLVVHAGAPGGAYPCGQDLPAKHFRCCCLKRCSSDLLSRSASATCGEFSSR